MQDIDAGGRRAQAADAHDGVQPPAGRRALLHVPDENHPLFEQQLAHPSRDDPHWAPFGFASSLLESWTVPTLLVDGWFDAPLPGVCDDFAALGRRGSSGRAAHRRRGPPRRRRRGRRRGDARVVRHGTSAIGPSDRTRSAPVAVARPGRRRTVARARRLAAAGVGADAGGTSTPGGRLATDAPTSARRRRTTYRYDPADPTPSLGGTGLMTGATVGQRPAQARDDVLVFTSDPLDAPLELVGPVTPSSSSARRRPHRLLREALRRAPRRPELQRLRRSPALRPDHDRAAPRRHVHRHRRVWPIGHRFGAGHRLRVQVSSGAHPVYGRNLGTGEPPATATENARGRPVCCTTIPAESRRSRCRTSPHDAAAG